MTHDPAGFGEERMQWRGPASLAGNPQGPIYIGVDRETVSDMIAASEARNATKIAEAVGKFEVAVTELRGDIKRLPGTWALVGSIVGSVLATGLAVAGIVLAAVSFGGDRFDQGLATRQVALEAARQAVDEQAARQSVAPPQLTGRPPG